MRGTEVVKGRQNGGMRDGEDGGGRGRGREKRKREREWRNAFKKRSPYFSEKEKKKEEKKKIESKKKIRRCYYPFLTNRSQKKRGGGQGDNQNDRRTTTTRVGSVMLSLYPRKNTPNTIHVVQKQTREVPTGFVQSIHYCMAL